MRGSEQGYIRDVTISGHQHQVVATEQQHRTVAHVSPPNWIRESRRRLLEFTQLPQDWDLEGGEPVEPIAAGAALKLLLRLGAEFETPPDLVPIGDGGVMVEWHTPALDLEIAIDSDLRGSIFYRDRLGNREDQFEHFFGNPRARTLEAE